MILDAEPFGSWMAKAGPAIWLTGDYEEFAERVAKDGHPVAPQAAGELFPFMNPLLCR